MNKSLERTESNNISHVGVWLAILTVLHAELMYLWRVGSWEADVGSILDWECRSNTLLNKQSRRMCHIVDAVSG
jgi:hypothetical protein